MEQIPHHERTETDPVKVSVIYVSSVINIIQMV